MSDITKIMDIINVLVNKNLLIVIEDNLDVIRQCDWIIDLGPNGGQILYKGKTLEIHNCKESITAKYI